jgi:flagellar motor switch protein FliG
MAQERDLSGAQKAAVLLMTIGTERASRVLRHLRESEVTEIAAEIARRTSVSEDAAAGVLGEFHTIAAAQRHVASGGSAVAKEMLIQGLGEKRAGEIFDQLAGALVEAPFEFLRKADPRQVLTFLRDEHPQVVALVLAHMRSEQSSLVLSGLDEEIQRDVSVRIATLDRTNPDVIAQVEASLQRRFSGVINSQVHAEQAADGVQTLVDILNRSDRSTERTIFDGLENFNPELADAVRSRMFVFEDVGSLDDRSIQLILRQVDPKELAMALKGVRMEVRTKIMKNMSERAGQNLEEEIVLLGPVKMKSVEEAQAAIVRVIRSLEESGQLVLARGGDEFVT